MEVVLISEKYVVITSKSDEPINKKKIMNYINSTLNISWDNICIDAFFCSKMNLYIIYPQESINIRFATYAFPFISEYFTE